MARLFNLADISTWPPHEQGIFVLEKLIQTHEQELANLEAQSGTNPESSRDAGRAADLRVIVRVLKDILVKWRATPQ